MKEKKDKHIIEKTWFHSNTGLQCVVLMTTMGHRCGYVGVPAGHLLFGVQYNDPIELSPQEHDAFLNSSLGKRGIIDLVCFQEDEISVGFLFDVHGGVTFSGRGIESDYPIKSNRWWFGFDCAHSGDKPDREYYKRHCKEMLKFYGDDYPGTTKSKEYVIEECANLARQIYKFARCE
jgi:hypothetical protein